jgi:hypothetical protein
MPGELHWSAKFAIGEPTMRSVSLNYPKLAAIAATRGMLGFGAGLLMAPRFSRDKRKAVGLTLLGVGIASTIPLAVSVLRGSSKNAA